MVRQRVLITGGAGFIGANLAHRLIGQGHDVTVFDNMSRSGCEANIKWLRETWGGSRVRLIRDDLADFNGLLRATDGAQRVYHLAAQVAVTTSVQDPRRDFESNALGTFNALEAARLSGDDPVFIYASTNKVYGHLAGCGIVPHPTRYCYADRPFGISEDEPLDFHSPYGCSKGAGDQYTRDYARMFGLRSVVMRQSCIYGYRQFGIEDQGWLAWFMIAALKGRQITVYGDGRQVRDVLFIDDLLDAYELAVDKIDVAAGEVFNVGGGPENSVSVWEEFGPLLRELSGRSVDWSAAQWRPGDQRVYVSDVRKIGSQLGWQPRIGVEEGAKRLWEWIRENEVLFGRV